MAEHMSEQTPALSIIRQGVTPTCLKPAGIICRGCPGWRAMRAALAPGGAWQGAVIHCPVTGLTARAREEGT